MPAIGELTATDIMARFFIMQQVTTVLAEEKEAVVSINWGNDRNLYLCEVQWGSYGRSQTPLDSRRAVAVAHIHTSDAEIDRHFSGLDINAANDLYQRQTMKDNVRSYVAVNGGQYLLRYDPKAFTITYIPGVWFHMPPGQSHIP